MRNKLKEWLEYVTNPNNTMSVVFDFMALCVAVLLMWVALSGGTS